MRNLLWLLVVAGLGTISITRPEPAKACGRYGHLTVCDLAYRNFTPSTRAAVNTMLQSRSGVVLVKGKGRMADRRYTSFNLGCLEEDALPRRNAADHFINGARTVPAIERALCPADGECILASIARDLALLWQIVCRG